MRQIIQFIPSAKPGHFFAWVITEGVMLKVPISVPRIFYLNSKAPITEEFPGRHVNKFLPRGKHNFNLIEVHCASILRDLCGFYPVVLF